jgi:hypothetical protein
MKKCSKNGMIGLIICISVVLIISLMISPFMSGLESFQEGATPRPPTVSSVLNKSPPTQPATTTTTATATATSPPTTTAAKPAPQPTMATKAQCDNSLKLKCGDKRDKVFQIVKENRTSVTPEEVEILKNAACKTLLDNKCVS